MMTTSARVLWLLAVMLTVPAIRASGADVAWADVKVRVYHGGVVAHADEERALAVAAAVLAPADVVVRWTHCHETQASDSRCAKTLLPGELIVRLVRSPLPARYEGAWALGEALVRPGHRAGTLATIHVGRVEWLAGAGGADVVTLLGRAIAHELVHLISGTGTHAAQGLMRAVWSSRDVAGNRTADWTLSGMDASLVRARMARRVGILARAGDVRPR